MTSRFSYFETEASTGAPNVLRFTSLTKLGIDQNKMIATLLPTFHNLEPDIYDTQRAKMHFLMDKAGPEACQCQQMREKFVRFYAGELKLEDFPEAGEWLTPADRETLDSITATRYRAATAFNLSLNDGSWDISESKLGPFVQDNVDQFDVRSVPRYFPRVSPTVAGSSILRSFLKSIAWLTHEVSAARKMRMVLHQIRVVADKNHPGENAPEGRHQDNANYVVTAAIMDRENITGAESIVCNADGSQVYFSREVQPGEVLFHADTPSQLWHDVTSLHPLAGCLTGSRSRFGLDIHVLE